MADDAAAAAAPEVEDVLAAEPAGLTDEGASATELDAATKLRFDNLMRKLEKGEALEEIAEAMGDLVHEGVERYGQLCPLLCPLFFRYGDVLLRIVERKHDALAAGGEEGEEEEDDEEGGSGSSSSAAGGAGAAAGSGASGAAGEEDLEKEAAADDANDDEVLAFEWLDSARILYEKQAPSRERDVDLARVHMRLGDLFSEGDKFTEAIQEFTAALNLRTKHLPKHDAAIAEALATLSVAHIQLASSKAVGSNEKERRSALGKAMMQAQAAAECTALWAADVVYSTLVAPAAAAADASSSSSSSSSAGSSSGASASALPEALVLAAGRFLSSLKGEVDAGALRLTYPVGITTSVRDASQIGTRAYQAPAGSAAGGAASAASSASSSSSSSGADAPTGDHEVRVFETVFKSTLGPFAPVEAAEAAKEAKNDASSSSSAAGGAAGSDDEEEEDGGASSSSSSSSSASASGSSSLPADVAKLLTRLSSKCTIIDGLLQRMNDITVDLGVSISSILSAVAGGSSSSSSSGGGVTTIGFGGGAASSASSSSAAGGAASIASDSIGFGAGAAAASAAAVDISSMIVARRKAPAASAAGGAAAAVASAGGDESSSASSVSGVKRKAADMSTGNGEEEDGAGAGEPAAKVARTEE